jgi:tRNA dimethylallyltransferase
MRLIRALSVSEASGKPFSSFRSNPSMERSYRIFPILLERPREELYNRINHRDRNARPGLVGRSRSLFPSVI